MVRLEQILEGWNDELNRAEKRIGAPLTGTLVSFVLMILGGLYASENILPLNFGQVYAALSENPFDFRNPSSLHFRIFSPVLGYILLLRGNLFPILTHGASLIFLTTIYVHLRRRSFKAVDALGFTFMMAFSINVLNEIHFPGTTDPVSYLLILWTILNLRKPVVWGVCFALALANHEANLFALPWLLLMVLMENSRTKERIAAIFTLALACIPGIMLRIALSKAINSSLPFSADFYFSKSNLLMNMREILPTLWLGIFSAYKLAWFFPLAAIMIHIHSGEKGRAFVLTAIVICAMAQVFFAKDITRLMGLAFPAVLLGAQSVRAKWGEDAFRIRMWGLLLLNLLVPQATAWGNQIIIFYPLPYTMFVQYFFGLPLR
jgi:hypothetical protein